MWKNVIHVFYGYIIWRLFKVKYRIGYQKVVLVLTGQSDKLDKAALDYLEYYVKRKFVKEAVILVKDAKAVRNIRKTSSSFITKLCICRQSKMNNLYDAYCFYQFYENIVFTYSTKPDDNMLGRLLEENLIDASEAICLGLFGLHQVPEREERNGEIHE